MPDSCKTCRFWEFGDHQDGNSLGPCQRLPPHLPTPEAIRDWFCRPDGGSESERPGIRGVWPITMDCDWCGEYEKEGE
jgi:hypothetical protein